MTSFLACGQANLHKSDIVSGDFTRYLTDLQLNYKLDATGAVKGMDHYYLISQEAREEQLARLALEKEERPKTKSKPRNVHTSKLVNETILKAKDSIPDKLDSTIGLNDLWNKDFMDSLLPFSTLEEADESQNPDFVTIDGEK